MSLLSEWGRTRQTYLTPLVKWLVQKENMKDTPQDSIQNMKGEALIGLTKTLSNIISFSISPFASSYYSFMQIGNYNDYHKNHSLLEAL